MWPDSLITSVKITPTLFSTLHRLDLSTRGEAHVKLRLYAARWFPPLLCLERSTPTRLDALGASRVFAGRRDGKRD